MKTLRVNTASRPYDIVLGAGALQQAGDVCDLRRKALIVTGVGVPSEYAKTVAAQCEAPTILTVSQGEQSKSMETLRDLLSAMLEKGFTRGDCVVAVGGGVVGDLAGFAAATYMRGIDFYNLPTTVLSQVDSSIGGKTAVNLNGIKNIVGAFYQPKGVLIDPTTLQTLPARQISNGLAEAVKMGLTSDAALFALFETEDPCEHLETIIERSLCVKRDVVTQDETEQGLRKILNFGHTIGHAIESCAGLGDLYHGECVALGMLPMCGASVRARLLPVLEKLHLATHCAVERAELIAAMRHDKKAQKDKLTVITVEEVGSYRMENVSPEDLLPRLSVIAKEDVT